MLNEQIESLFNAYELILASMRDSLENGEHWAAQITQYEFPIQFPTDDEHKLPFILSALGALIRSSIEEYIREGHMDEAKEHELRVVFNTEEWEQLTFDFS